MFEEYKYKTELHAHTSPASFCSQITPEHMVEVYKNQGYTSVTITNHFISDSGEEMDEFLKKYLDDYHKTKELGEKVGLNIILGAEIRFTENMNDYLIYGIEEEELPQIYSWLDKGIDSFYKSYKNERNVIFQAHPFRNNMERANPKSVDGIEVFNLHPGHNSRIGYAAKYARENNLLITAGSDFHHFGQEAQCSILTKEKLKDSLQLAKVLKEQDFIIDISGFKVLPK